MAVMAQMGFFDLSDRYASLDAKKDPLVEITTSYRGKSSVRFWSRSGASLKVSGNPMPGVSR
jgi:hypothetical protein